MYHHKRVYDISYLFNFSRKETHKKQLTVNRENITHINESKKANQQPQFPKVKTFKLLLINEG